jgi:hypothetical protein
VQQLMGMGFSRQQVIEVLTITGGNADMAASYLLYGG